MWRTGGWSFCGWRKINFFSVFPKFLLNLISVFIIPPLLCTTNTTNTTLQISVNTTKYPNTIATILQERQQHIRTLGKRKLSHNINTDRGQRVSKVPNQIPAIFPRSQDHTITRQTIWLFLVWSGLINLVTMQ